MTASTYGVLRHFDDFLPRTNHWMSDVTSGYPKSTEKENETWFWPGQKVNIEGFMQERQMVFVVKALISENIS
ncbi:hypothetical protein AC249_AIPGENE13388 [Exaiptasia diaphana]|nr:hypothetical protein AC249_AIPGENE13388 [Exaiptasia diaphana]